MQIITVHSFRRGAGKSHLAANLAALLALDGRRVAVLDADFQSPSQSLILRLPEDQITFTLNDCLWKKCGIESSIYDVTKRQPAPLPGKLYLAPASGRVTDVMKMLRTSYTFDALCSCLEALPQHIDLDYLLMDTTAGLSDETMSCIALAESLVIMLRPEQSDYQGTAVTIEIARNLQVPRLFLVLNDTPLGLDLAKARLQLQETFHCEVGAILPHTEEIQSLGSTNAFTLSYPKHPMTNELKKLKEKIS